MTLPAPTARTLVHTTKQLLLSDVISTELLQEFVERQKALETTKTLIKQALVTRPEFNGLGILEVTYIGYKPNDLKVNVTYSIYVDGKYHQQPAQVAFIEASTLNLLLSTKLLTDKEKRELLAARNLLPASRDANE